MQYIPVNILFKVWHHDIIQDRISYTVQDLTYVYAHTWIHTCYVPVLLHLCMIFISQTLNFKTEEETILQHVQTFKARLQIHFIEPYVIFIHFATALSLTKQKTKIVLQGVHAFFMQSSFHKCCSHHIPVFTVDKQAVWKLVKEQRICMVIQCWYFSIIRTVTAVQSWKQR